APRRDVRVLIVGVGPEEERLRALAADLGVADAVEFRGWVPYDELPAVYAQASCLVLASLAVEFWEEQFGMVLAEAMAVGLCDEVVEPAQAERAVGRWVKQLARVRPTSTKAIAAVADLCASRELPEALTAVGNLTLTATSDPSVIEALRRFREEGFIGEEEA
ncbi:MAG TPA: glycosyltransferase, partial [Polyangiaceae bacterium]|nr:glycosyltransferase [Polyangiaceae bacterium]